MIAARALGRAIARGASRVGRAVKGVVRPTAAQKAARQEAKLAKLKRTEQLRKAKLAAAKPKYELKAAKVAAKAPKAGLGAGTGLVAGMTISDLLTALKGEGAGAGDQGGALAGGYPEAYQGIADSAVKAQALHDKTVLKLARLEARTRLKLAKIQRNRDLAVTYLANPVIGIGVAYATVVGVKTAIEYAAQAKDSMTANAMRNVGSYPQPTLTMVGAQLPEGAPAISNPPEFKVPGLDDAFQGLTGMSTPTTTLGNYLASLPGRLK